MSGVKVIDLSDYPITISDTEEKERLGNGSLKKLQDDLITALSETGTCYLVNHGVSLDMLNNACSSIRDFMNLPVETKRKWSPKNKVNYEHGWEEKMERLEKNNLPDMAECVHMTFAGGERWPDDDAPAVRINFTQFYDETMLLAKRLLDLVSHALDFNDKNFLRKSLDTPNSNLRVNYYRPIDKPPSDLPPNQLRFSEHQDRSLVTILYQDCSGGLQTMIQTGEYVDVGYVEGSILFQMGTPMEIYSSGKCIAPMHRVMVPQNKDRLRERVTLVHFVGPSSATEIRPLDGSDKYPTETFQSHVWDYYANLGITKKTEEEEQSCVNEK